MRSTQMDTNFLCEIQQKENFFLNLTHILSLVIFAWALTSLKKNQLLFLFNEALYDSGI